MRIAITEIRRATDVLLKHLEDSGYEAFELTDDFYWSIAPEQRYDPYKRPVELSMGQLSDDLAEVRAIAEGSNAPVAYGLVWLSSLMRAIGERVIA